MRENMETGDVRQKQASALKLTRTSTLPLVTAETPENGQTKGENMEMDDVGRKREIVAELDADTNVATCYSGNARKRLNEG
jgi:hypothetical protein